MKKLIQRILNSLKNFIKSGLDEYYQISQEDLFLHHWRDKK